MQLHSEEPTHPEKPTRPPVQSDALWLVYMIQTQNGRLYTGITNSIERRCRQHLAGNGAKFFRTNPPQALVWLEVGHDRRSASRREYEIKQMRRPQKLALIQQSRFPSRALPLTQADDGSSHDKRSQP